jgi:tRNA(Ile2) C34 agmatinyltransferase TiaS
MNEMGMIYIGIDDTDSRESRGTGRLARDIAAELSKSHKIYGVTRHQLFVHEDIPCTSHNSCAVIHLEATGTGNGTLKDLFGFVREMMCADFIEGSDPGLSIGSSDQITPGIVAFGLDAKRTILTQKRARDLAANTHVLLEGLGGTEDGVIGAVAGLGLAALKSDGRFVLKDRNRELTGAQPVSDILGAGIDQIMTLDGRVITGGIIDLKKSPKPSFMQGKAVLFVEEYDGGLTALKRD